MKYLDIVNENRKLSVELKSPKYEVGIVSNITTAPIKDILELSL